MAKDNRLVINGVTVKQTGHVEVQWADEVFDESDPTIATHTNYKRKTFDSWAKTPAEVRQWVIAIVQGAQSPKSKTNTTGYFSFELQLSPKEKDYGIYNLITD